MTTKQSSRFFFFFFFFLERMDREAGDAFTRDAGTNRRHYGKT
jgi:hypothetical protein